MYSTCSPAQFTPSWERNPLRNLPKARGYISFQIAWSQNNLASVYNIFGAQHRLLSSNTNWLMETVNLSLRLALLGWSKRAWFPFCWLMSLTISNFTSRNTLTPLHWNYFLRKANYTSFLLNSHYRLELSP